MNQTGYATGFGSPGPGFNCNVGLGYLIDNRFGIGPAMTLSFVTMDELAANRGMLQLCKRWRISAKYLLWHATLSMIGAGDPMPVPLDGQGQIEAMPVWTADWNLPIEGACEFMEACGRFGFFFLFYALQGGEVVNRDSPTIAHLYVR